MSWLSIWFIFELTRVRAAPHLSKPQAFKILSFANDDHQTFTFCQLVFEKLHHIQVLTFDMNM